MSKSNERTIQFSIEELGRALKIAARVVALYGEIYLPIFNRLHAEMTKAKEDENAKALALRIALSYTEGK